MKTTNESMHPDEHIVCPNCGKTAMELDPMPILKLDGLEWLATFGATTFLYRSMRDIIGILIDFFGVQVYSNNIITSFFEFIGFALAFSLSYSVVVELSTRQARRNGVSVWHLRCEHCRVKYRVVRPYDTSVPWELPEEHDEANNDAYKEGDLDAFS